MLLGLLVLQGPLVTPLGGIARAVISLISNAVWHLKRFLCCSAWRGLAQLQRERAHRFLLADVQAQGGHRDNNGLELHQANRLEAIASAINHVTGRSSFVPRRGGR